LTKVKICGLSTKEAVETAVSAGADYIGFVFAPSKRQVTLDQAAELAKLILFENLPCASIQAVQVDGEGHVPNSQADYLLFDAPVAGSGQTFDWGKLDTTGIAQSFFIAGGLNEDNVVQAIQHFTPYAVDVSSGVETDGQKDHEKIKRFIERVKNGISRT